MALIECKNCGGTYIKDGDSACPVITCPLCGAKPKKKKSGVPYFFFLIICLIAWPWISHRNSGTPGLGVDTKQPEIPYHDPSTSQPAAVSVPVNGSDDQGCFSIIDGSHIGLEKYIKQAMNDPDSYQHVKTLRIEYGGVIQVKEIFRGKNKFGAMVLDDVTAIVDNSCNVKEIINKDGR